MVRWPAVLFLHGSGERGSDGLKQCSVGIGPFIAENPHLFDALVIFPQIPRTMSWSLEGGLLVAMAALERVCTNGLIIPEQIYLTGLSMGGAGAWILAENFPNMFAAVVPIAAAVSVTEKTQLLRNTPIWAFQSADDEICPPETELVNQKKLETKVLEHVATMAIDRPKN